MKWYVKALIVLGVLIAILYAVYKLFNSAWSGIVGAVTGPPQMVLQGLEGVFGAIDGAVGGIVGGIGGIGNSLGTAANSALGGVLGAGSGVLTAGSDIQSFFGTLWNDITGSLTIRPYPQVVDFSKVDLSTAVRSNASTITAGGASYWVPSSISDNFGPPQYQTSTPGHGE